MVLVDTGSRYIRRVTSGASLLCSIMLNSLVVIVLPGLPADFPSLFMGFSSFKVSACFLPLPGVTLANFGEVRAEFVIEV